MSSKEAISDHFHSLIQLLRIEREEDLRQYQNKVANRSIQEKKKEGVCWYPVAMTDHKKTVGDKFEITVERTDDLFTKMFFQSGTLVSIFSNQSDSEYRVSGVISFIRNEKMKIVINSADVPDWLFQGKLGIDLLFDDSAYKEMEFCLKSLVKVDKGRLDLLKRLFIGDDAPSFRNTYGYTIPTLNSSQNLAVNHALATNEVGLIHGPPGTGKTTTLVKCIKAVVAEEKQVLVSAPSNVAVDILVERLVADGVSVVRLGHPARVTDQVMSSTIDAGISDHVDYKTLKALRRQAEEYWKMGAKYKRNFGPAEREQRRQVYAEAKRLKAEARRLEDYIVEQLINQAGVIACTLTGASHRLIRDRYFKSVFIDEAGQAIEPACWIPVSKAERVIMAGDHQQLPPTVKSMEAAKGGLEITLFERVIKKGVGQLLNEQYRMQPEIMAYPNEYFYGGELRTADEVLNRHSIYEGREVIFIDTAGCGFDEKINEQTLSTYNREEAKLLLKHLSDTLRVSSDDLDIGIIAPYKAQVNTIRDEISNYDLGDYEEGQISIHSVDGFQGQEKDIIYVSMVRSNDKGEIGFLKNIRRMNVAMTRAKYKLVMVGDSATLSVHPFYDKMISYFQTQQWYMSAFEIIYAE